MLTLQFCFVWPEKNMVQSLTFYAFFFKFFLMFDVYKNSQSFDMQ